MSYKKWVLLFFITVLSFFLLSTCIMILVDPFFIYHKPSKNISYVLDNPRYQNIGIVTKYDYDTIITGSSIMSNFLTSEFDSLFSTNSIKVNIPGSTYIENTELLDYAFKSNPNIKYIFRSIDSYGLGNKSDIKRYSEDSFPYYLYDRSIINDYPYMLNKELLFSYSLKNINQTLHNIPSTSFDDYNNESTTFAYSKDITMNAYSRMKHIDQETLFNDRDQLIEKDNIERNFTNMIKEHPETEFYLFFPPSNILFWDKNYQKNTISYLIEQSKYATSLILEYDNVHLFSFFDHHEIIENLDYYRDYNHYNGEVCSMILHWMKEGTGELTKENYIEYYNYLYDYYSSYNYDSLFQ